MTALISVYLLNTLKNLRGVCVCLFCFGFCCCCLFLLFTVLLPYLITQRLRIQRNSLRQNLCGMLYSFLCDSLLSEVLAAVLVLNANFCLSVLIRSLKAVDHCFMLCPYLPVRKWQIPWGENWWRMSGLFQFVSLASIILTFLAWLLGCFSVCLNDWLFVFVFYVAL